MLHYYKNLYFLNGQKKNGVSYCPIQQHIYLLHFTFINTVTKSEIYMKGLKSTNNNYEYHRCFPKPFWFVRIFFNLYENINYYIER